MRVLVTRAGEDAIRTAREIAERGHEALLAPLSEIRFLYCEDIDLSGVQAILATSSNGVRAFARCCPRRDVPIFTVGVATAAAARAAGFVQVTSSAGDSLMLSRLIGESLEAGAGALLHVAGRNTVPVFGESLVGAGFDLRVRELYEIVYRTQLPEELVEAFRRSAVDAVLVLSPESGRRLVRSIGRTGLAANCRRVVACCISAAAAAATEGIDFGDVRVAARPDLDSVLALLDLGPIGAHA